MKMNKTHDMGHSLSHTMGPIDMGGRKLPHELTYRLLSTSTIMHLVCTLLLAHTAARHLKHLSEPRYTNGSCRAFLQGDALALNSYMRLSCAYTTHMTCCCWVNALRRPNTLAVKSSNTAACAICPELHRQTSCPSCDCHNLYKGS